MATKNTANKQSEEPTLRSVLVTFDLGTEGTEVIVAQKKVFSTGSRGYHASGKIEIAGKRYQVNVQLIEIGSKPK